MANTITTERARPKVLFRMSFVVNLFAVILGGSFSAHASAHEEYDWAMFFFLIGLLNAAMALVNSRNA